MRLYLKLHFLIFTLIPLWFGKLIAFGQSFESEIKTFLLVAFVGLLSSFFMERQRQTYEETYKDRVDKSKRPEIP